MTRAETDVLAERARAQLAEIHGTAAPFYEQAETVREHAANSLQMLWGLEHVPGTSVRVMSLLEYAGLSARLQRIMDMAAPVSADDARKAGAL